VKSLSSFVPTPLCAASVADAFAAAPGARCFRHDSCLLVDVVEVSGDHAEERVHTALLGSLPSDERGPIFVVHVELPPFSLQYVGYDATLLVRPFVDRLIVDRAHLSPLYFSLAFTYDESPSAGLLRFLTGVPDRFHGVVHLGIGVFSVSVPKENLFVFQLAIRSFLAQNACAYRREPLSLGVSS